MLKAYIVKNAWMVELVDTRDLKSRGPCARVGSTPTLGTMSKTEDFHQSPQKPQSHKDWGFFIAFF